MTPENTQKFFYAFPFLYRGRTKSVQESLMSFGFDHGDGWFDLIWTLSQNIEDAAKQAGLKPRSYTWPEATQVKQKIGTLRFYLNNQTETMAALIRKAEQDSARTCEIFGNLGTTLRSAGVKTLCDHRQKEGSLETSVLRTTPIWR